MKKVLVTILMISGFLYGCSQNHFNVPTGNFAERVKILGIIPIIVDVDSDIRHPQKEQLVQIITDMNRKYEHQFIRKVKGTGNFYTVALMDGDPQKIFDSLLFRREKRDDATIQYNKYFLKNEKLRDYIKRNKLDAVMLIIVSGLTKTEKILSSNLLSSMTSEYNFLTMTAQILDSNANILWEYPNFRRRILAYSPMINLQYPDFSEAEANLSNKPNLKFKTLDGIQRSLDQKRKDLLLRETQEAEIYGKQFDEMLSILKYDADSNRKGPADGSKTVVAPDEAAPAIESPNPAKTQPIETQKQPAEGPKSIENDIVPATGSTL